MWNKIRSAFKSTVDFFANGIQIIVQQGLGAGISIGAFTLSLSIIFAKLVKTNAQIYTAIVAIPTTAAIFIGSEVVKSSWYRKRRKTLAEDKILIEKTIENLKKLAIKNHNNRDIRNSYAEIFATMEWDEIHQNVCFAENVEKAIERNTESYSLLFKICTYGFNVTITGFNNITTVWIPSILSMIWTNNLDNEEMKQALLPIAVTYTAYGACVSLAQTFYFWKALDNDAVDVNQSIKKLNTLLANNREIITAKVGKAFNIWTEAETKKAAKSNKKAKKAKNNAQNNQATQNRLGIV